MNVLHSSVRTLCVCYGLSGNNSVSIVEVSECITVYVEEAHEGCSVRRGYVYIIVEQTVLLNLLHSGSGQTGTGDTTGLSIVVVL